MTLYAKRSSIAPGEASALLTTWSPATEREARADIARKYSQKPDSRIVDGELERIHAGQQIFGNRFAWSTAIPGPEGEFCPWTKCPVCDYRTPERLDVCPKCSTVIAQAVLV